MGQIAIEKILTNVISSLDGNNNPKIEKNGELFSIALINDITKYNENIQCQINNISITGSFTPLSQTANITASFLSENIKINDNIKKIQNDINENILKINDNVDYINQDIKKIKSDYTTNEITNLLFQSCKDYSEKLNNQILENANNITNIQNKCVNNETFDNLSKEYEIKHQTLIKDNQDNINQLNDKILNNENTINELNSKLNVLVETLKENQNIINTLQSKIEDNSNQNKEMMRFMISMKTKINGF